jgi:hypothetical protein
MNPSLTLAIFVVVVCFIAVVVAIIMNSNSKDKAVEARLRDLNNAEDIFVSKWDRSFIALSFDQSKIAIGRHESTRECTFSQMIQADLLRDDDVVTSTDRGSLVSRALVGGVLLGGVGAVIGGVTAKTYSAQKLTKLILRVVTESGTFSVTFLDLTKLQRDEGLDGIRDWATGEADRYYGLVLRAMRQSNQPRQAVVSSIASRPAAASSSVSLEIERLWKLKERGIISSDEFALAKAKILPPS